jgi:starch synthase (maltosyl-transferring)
MIPPLLYNLFPRLVGPIPRWQEHAERAREMGFDWLYLNPWHYPGFSGSLYAPKEFRRINPLFLPDGGDEHDLGILREALRRMKEIGIRPMMDLVVNHTSKDSPLIDEHPGWYVRDEHGEVVSPWVADPDDPDNITVWGDLAEIDNWSAAKATEHPQDAKHWSAAKATEHPQDAKHEGSPDRDRLWAYWAELVRDSLELGFEGFRCDAAYKVPAELWRLLIEEAHRINPEAEFFAETLGAPAEDIRALADAGFDYFFNSSKWWDFREPWALEQHEEFRLSRPPSPFRSRTTPRGWQERRVGMRRCSVSNTPLPPLSPQA